MSAQIELSDARDKSTGADAGRLRSRLRDGKNTDTALHAGRVVLRPTRPDDLPHLIGEPLPWRVRAITGEIDGRVIGIGGLTFLPGGTVAAWTALTDEALRHKITLHRAALRLLREAKAAGYSRIVACADPESVKAVRWLERLGFECLAGMVYVWRPDS